MLVALAVESWAVALAIGIAALTGSSVLRPIQNHGVRDARSCHTVLAKLCDKIVVEFVCIIRSASKELINELDVR